MAFLDRWVYFYNVVLSFIINDACGDSTSHPNQPIVNYVIIERAYLVNTFITNTFLCCLASILFFFGCLLLNTKEFCKEILKGIILNLLTTISSFMPLHKAIILYPDLLRVSIYRIRILSYFLLIFHEQLFA